MVLRRWIRSDEGLTLETSAFESLYGGQLKSSTQLIKPNYSGDCKVEIEFTVESRFFEPPRETKILVRKNRRVQEIEGKIAVFD